MNVGKTVVDILGTSNQPYLINGGATVATPFVDASNVIGIVLRLVVNFLGAGSSVDFRVQFPPTNDLSGDFTPAVVFSVLYRGSGMEARSVKLSSEGRYYRVYIENKGSQQVSVWVSAWHTLVLE